ncbi:MAG: hypothetical protein OCU18_00310 [Candidatus Syntrophoarchaeum sp.]|nr:hypothetical protein [Candidatus Syntrophoarchaeum sp.]
MEKWLDTCKQVQDARAIFDVADNMEQGDVILKGANILDTYINAFRSNCKARCWW